LNFLREEPVMGWFALIAFLVTIVPVASVLWRRMFGRGQTEVAKLPVHETKLTRFGNHADLIILFVGLVLLLAVIDLVRSIFFG